MYNNNINSPLTKDGEFAYQYIYAGEVGYLEMYILFQLERRYHTCFVVCSDHFFNTDTHYIHVLAYTHLVSFLRSIGALIFYGVIMVACMRDMYVRYNIKKATGEEGWGAHSDVQLHSNTIYNVGYIYRLQQIG